MIAVPLLRGAERQKAGAFAGSRSGSTVALVVWIVASAAFAFYVANFGSYDKIYGTLGGVVTVFIWLWISNLALLFGHELNAERERSHEFAEACRAPKGRSSSSPATSRSARRTV